jgi:hypothetical protein
VVGRLNALVDEHARLQVQLNEFYSRDERQRGEWTAGGRVGMDPGNPVDTPLLSDNIVGVKPKTCPDPRQLSGRPFCGVAWAAAGD